MIKCIVVEDAPLAVEKLVGFVRQVPSLVLSGTFGNGLDALRYLQEDTVDLIFLDIQMEQFDGLRFMEDLPHKPKIIIVSAYSEYAIHGFEHNVSDYLLKPYSFERFLKAVDRVQQELQPTVRKTYFFVKTAYRMERIDFDDILYVEGQGAYVRIVTTKNKVMTLQRLSQLETFLPENFQRIHKSYIVALDKIEHVERGSVVIAGQRLSVGKNYQAEFYNRL